jgi:Ca2+-binding EF-hand superfamily protein
MNLSKAGIGLALGLTLVSAPLAFAADGDGMVAFREQMQSMANKDGMISRKEFLAMMERKFDAMDKDRKGMLSIGDLMRIFSDSKGQ